MTTDGDTNQQMLGMRFGGIRAEILKVTQRELAESLTTFANGELISPTRISDSERGKANFTTAYAQLFMGYLRSYASDTYDTLELDEDFQQMLTKLPTHPLVHRENESPGNTYDGPRAAPIAKVNRRKVTASPDEDATFSVSFQGGAVTFTAYGFRITIER